MTVTAENIRLWLGPSAMVLTDAELEEMISMAEDIVTQMVASSGSSGTPDTPVKYVTAAHVYRALDARNVRPASISEGGVSVSTDIGTACEQFMAKAEKAVKNYVLALAGTEGRAGGYFIHVRGIRRCHK